MLTDRLKIYRDKCNLGCLLFSADIRRCIYLAVADGVCLHSQRGWMQMRFKVALGLRCDRYFLYNGYYIT